MNAIELLVLCWGSLGIATVVSFIELAEKTPVESS